MLMLSPEEREQLGRALRVCKILWWAIAASVGIYVALCKIGEAEMHGITEMGDELPKLRSALIAVAVATLLITPLIHKLALKRPGLISIAWSFFRTQTHMRRAIYKYTQGMIVALAISESMAIYGLILFMLGDSFGTLYAFSAASLASMYMYYPRVEAIEALATEMKLSQPAS